MLRQTPSCEAFTTSKIKVLHMMVAAAGLIYQWLVTKAHRLAGVHLEFNTTVQTLFW